MSEELEILRIVIDRLEEINVHYFISGSMASNYYSIPRMTRDIDIVLELKISDLDHFIKIFQDDFYIEEDTIREEIARNGMFNAIHREYAFKVDFIMRKETEFQHSCFKRCKKINLGDYSAWMISSEDLIIAKLLWAKDSFSEMQLKDVHNLMRTVKNLDKIYLEQWINQLFLKDVYEKVGV